MKCKIEEKEAKTRIPEIGEPWKHRGVDPIYIRVADEQGQLACPSGYPLGYFFSVDISSGRIVQTSHSSETIIILQPKGGKVIFEEKTSGD